MTRTLRKGNRGPDVLQWQTFLSQQGHDPGKLDGAFGEGTVAATRSFQNAHGLEADAVVGPKTLAQAAALGLQVIRRLRNSELMPALTAQAKRILALHHHEPFGSQFRFAIDEVRYVARIEEHYHPPGGPLKPWGHHPGVSLFVETGFDNQIVVPDEITDTPTNTDTTDDEAPVIAHRGVVVLDPGHGGEQMLGGSSPNNARSPSGVLEKELTLVLAEIVRSRLAELGSTVRVELTRNSDQNPSLADRARLSGTLGADLFVSIHFNGFNGEARGVEAHVRPKTAGNVNLNDDRRLAQALTHAVHQALSSFDPTTPNRGVKESNLGVLRDDLLGNTAAQHPCRACLLEIEFLDVPAVDQLFNTGPKAAQVRAAVGDAIAMTLLEELGRGFPK
jgi:N-acetylmuramoyl-L-alanine amidase